MGPEGREYRMLFKTLDRPWIEVEDGVQMGSCRQVIQEVILQILTTNKDLAGYGKSSKREI